MAPLDGLISALRAGIVWYAASRPQRLRSPLGEGRGWVSIENSTVGLQPETTQPHVQVIAMCTWEAAHARPLDAVS